MRNEWESTIRGIEQRFRARWKNLRIISLETAQPGFDLSLWIEDGLIKALVSNQAVSPALLRQEFHHSFKDEELPSLLVVTLSEERLEWKRLSSDGWVAIDEEDVINALTTAKGQSPTMELAKRIILKIHAENQDAINSRLTQGFLSLLNRTFQRKDLYVFELLQNAIDENALEVVFKIEEAGRCLVVEHSGCPFTAADVLGLSCVGMSGKSGRTLGFMGTGFKAVFQRFARVRITDGTWSFCFDEASSQNRSGWQVLPLWDEELANRPLRAPFRCRFELEEPIGGLEAILSDLSDLPNEIPVLLGRRILQCEGNTSQAWQLQWNDRPITVARFSHDDPLTEVFALTKGGEHQRWRVLSCTFTPTEEAVNDFRQFREDSQYEPGPQEISLLFRDIDEQLSTQVIKGQILAIMPTNRELPMGYHFQANWLPTADRQGVRSLKDSPWNREIAQRLPTLLIQILEWMASENGPLNLHQAYAMLPVFEFASGTVPIVKILNYPINVPAVVKAIQQKRLAPVLNKEGETSRQAFAKADDVIILPSPFLQRVSPHFLRTWTSKEVFALNTVGKGIEFWESTGALSRFAGILSADDKSHLKDLYFPHGSPEIHQVLEVINFLAAFQESKEKEAALFIGNAPIVPNDAGDICRASELDRLSDAYFSLPEAIKEILASFIPHERILNLALQKQLSQTPPDGQDETWELAKRLLAWNSRPTVKITPLCRDFLESLHDEALTQQHIQQVVVLTRWIHGKKNISSAINGVLVGCGNSVIVKDATKAYLGSGYTGSNELEVAAGPDLFYVADNYMTLEWPAGVNPIIRKDWEDFFLNLPHPVNSGLHLILSIEYSEITSRSVASYNVNELLSVKSSATESELPQGVRAPAPNEIAVLDYEFPPEWLEILRAIQNSGDSMRGRAMSRLLGEAIKKYPFPQAHPVCIFPHNRSGKCLTALVQSCDSKWIKTLKQFQWVPTSKNGVARPAEVFLGMRDNKHDFLVATLDEETRGNPPTS